MLYIIFLLLIYYNASYIRNTFFSTLLIYTRIKSFFNAHNFNVLSKDEVAHEFKGQPGAIVHETDKTGKL